VFTSLQYALLKRIAPREKGHCSGAAYKDRDKLDVLLGKQSLADLRDKVVVDFGCGEGWEAIELARKGAKHVIGVDIRENLLSRAREHAAQAGVADRCEFTPGPVRYADVVVSVDAFEHFANPGQVLDLMYESLPPGGFVLASFGPTWYHPYGGHLFSLFPWAHLVFSESALIRWRSDLRNDGATRFREVEGGLNQMTIAHFERLVAASSFQLDRLEAVPIRRLSGFHNRFTREFLTSIVRARLVKPLRSNAVQTAA